MKNDKENDPGQALMLDAQCRRRPLAAPLRNDVTASPMQCDGCRREGMLGEARTYMQAPGVVLRCKRCDTVMLRVVETPEALYLEARGLTYLCLPLTRKWTCPHRLPSTSSGLSYSVRR